MGEIKEGTSGVFNKTIKHNFMAMGPRLVITTHIIKPFNKPVII